MGLAALVGCSSNPEGLSHLATDAEVEIQQSRQGVAATDHGLQSMPQPVQANHFGTMVLDGAFDDWAGVDSILTDHGLAMTAAHDDDWVYLRMSQDEIRNVQGLKGTLRLEFDLDGNPMTGVMRSTENWDRPGLAGVDAHLDFSPQHPDRGMFGVGLTIHESGFGATAVNPYISRAVFAPTYASREIEMRIARGWIAPSSNVAAFNGEHARLRWVQLDDAGKTINYSAPLQIGLTERGSDSSTASMIQSTNTNNKETIASPRGTLRFISWNTERGKMFESPERYARILRALDPDVVYFQELGEKATSRELRHWMDEHVHAPEGWQTTVSPGSGTGIATRLASASTGPRQMPAISDRYHPVRATNLLIGYGGKRILATSVHLKCCGKIGDRSDQKRIAETKIIAKVLDELDQEDMPIGMITMGDFNLVGSREPLDNLLIGRDMDGSDMLDVAPLSLGGLTSSTWRRDTEVFLPGRLDYAVVSDSTIQVKNAFVFDTALLGDEVLESMNLQADDSLISSDHLPLVLDVIW